MFSNRNTNPQKIGRSAQNDVFLHEHSLGGVTLGVEVRRRSNYWPARAFGFTCLENQFLTFVG